MTFACTNTLALPLGSVSEIARTA